MSEQIFSEVQPGVNSPVDWQRLFSFREEQEYEADRRLPQLAFLASAIATRTLKVVVSAQQEPSYCDGHCIYLDPELPEQRQAAVVAVHAALIAAGSFELKYLKAISLRQSVAQRFFALELGRAIRMCEPLLPVELITQIPLPDNKVNGIEQSLARAKNFGVDVALAADWLGIFRARRILKNQGATVKKSTAAGKVTSFSDVGLEEHDDDEELDTTGAKALNLFSNPLVKDSWLGDLFQHLLGMGRGGASDDDESGGAGDHVSGSAYQGSGAEIEITENTQLVDEITGRVQLLPEAADWSYPEWNYRDGAYRENWVSVNEIEALPDRSGSFEHCDVSDHTLARQLFNVGVEYENHRRQPFGSDIDVDALVEHLVDRAAGYTHEEAIYCKSQRTRRDLSAMMLVDISRSTADKIEGDKTIFGQQVSAASLIADAFSSFGDRVAVYGFHSWGRAITRLIRIKRFEELQGAIVKERFASLTPAGLTRLGAAIRHASFRLQQEKYNTHRLLMIFTDGFAYDDEYEGRYAEEDTAKALGEARAKGVACVCISIGTEKDDEALARVFGASTYLRCRYVSDLPGRLKRLTNLALRQVERSAKHASVSAA